MRRSLALGLAGVVLALGACSRAPAPPAAPDPLAFRRELFARLAPNLAQPLRARVQAMPEDLLRATRDYDVSIGIAGAQGYRAHAPSAAELALFDEYVALLPSAHRAVLSGKLLAVYFVDGFAGAGLTDWVPDPQDRLHYYVVFNAGLLTRSLDDWLSARDDASFTGDEPAPHVVIRTGTAYRALLYGLLHEGTHMVDYERGLTPLIDPLHARLTGRKEAPSDFTTGVWDGQRQPRREFDYAHRGELNLYAMFSGRPLLPRAALPPMLEALARTPFVSFYGGTTWNEDLADVVTYHHLERRLGGAITVELVQAGAVVGRFAPMQRPPGAGRARVVESFYEPAAVAAARDFP